MKRFGAATALAVAGWMAMAGSVAAQPEPAREVAGCRIVPGTLCSEKNLAGADFRNARLARSQFSGSRLQGADFSGADLTGANLSNANLRGADLRGAKLADARFEGADRAGCKGCP